VASAIGVFAIAQLTRQAGFSPYQNAFLNAATEMTAFLLVGPLAGALADATQRAQGEADRWLARVEELTVHDNTFGTLKPDWAKVRLDAEVLRATRFQRPLSVALMQFDPDSDAAADNGAERVAALQAVIRVGRAMTQPPIVVAHTGGEQVLFILPEHSSDQAQQFTNALRLRLQRAVYFPPGAWKSLGRPLNERGGLRVGLASLNGQAELGETLIARARAVLC
jgi:GGDEF domain-containing protein